MFLFVCICILRNKILKVKKKETNVVTEEQSYSWRIVRWVYALRSESVLVF